MITISFIIIKDREHFDRLAEILALVPLAYSGLNVWQKVKKRETSENET